MQVYYIPGLAVSTAKESFAHMEDTVEPWLIDDEKTKGLWLRSFDLFRMLRRSEELHLSRLQLYQIWVPRCD